MIGDLKQWPSGNCFGSLSKILILDFLLMKSLDSSRLQGRLVGRRVEVYRRRYVSRQNQFEVSRDANSRA